MAQDEVTQRSVTRDETEWLTQNKGAIRYTVFTLPGPPMVRLPAQLPEYWSAQRDLALMQAYREGGLWTDAVNIAVTRVATLGFDLTADVDLRVRRSRELLNADWYRLLGKITRDFVCRDNGGFIEIVRATKAYGSKVLGFKYLQSSRCVRTGRDDVPVLYMDLLGSYHELQAHQVAEFSDMPDDDFQGVGLCATSRAYSAIYEHLAIRTYFSEKATGKRPLALDFIGGIGPKQLQSAINEAKGKTEDDGNNAASYMGAAVVTNPNTERPVSHVRVPLAELPDRFNQVEHTELTQIEFATALGIDPVDLNPRLIGNRALGAGSQAKVLDDKQNSKGLISLRQQITQFLNDTERWHVLPGATTFAWSERDLADQQAKAALQQTRAATRASQVQSGEINTDQARQLGVDAGDLPASFIKQDETDETTLSDEDKSEASNAIQPNPNAPSTQPPANNQAQPMNAEKELMLALKATKLASLTPSRFRSRGRVGKAEQEYLQTVTKGFDEIGRLWTLAAREHVPQKEGETNRSIRYAVTNKNTRGVTLGLYVGNASRPDVAIRSILFGRKAFGPKNKKWLKFNVGGKDVFARAVKGVKANNWAEKAWDQIQPHLQELEGRLGLGVSAEHIDVNDIEGAKVWKTAQSSKPLIKQWMKKYGAKKKK